MCSPVSVIWSPTFPVGCINLLTFNYFNAAFHILTDLILAILPIPVLMGLQLSRKRKIALAMVFGAGILTIAATVARQAYNFIALTGPDFSWNWAPTELATNLEINMAIICASVPALQTFFKAVLGIPTTRAYASDPSAGHSSNLSRTGRKWYSRESSVKELSRGCERTESAQGIFAQGIPEDENNSGLTRPRGGPDMHDIPLGNTKGPLDSHQSFA